MAKVHLPDFEYKDEVLWLDDGQYDEIEEEGRKFLRHKLLVEFGDGSRMHVFADAALMPKDELPTDEWPKVEFVETEEGETYFVVTDETISGPDIFVEHQHLSVSTAGKALEKLLGFLVELPQRELVDCPACDQDIDPDCPQCRGRGVVPKDD